jgi:uncharacterized protein (DUF2236 family)
MQLSWSGRQQRQFDRLLAVLSIIDRVVPRQFWVLGYRIYLWDMRWRARRGRPVV